MRAINQATSNGDRPPKPAGAARRRLQSRRRTWRPFHSKSCALALGRRNCGHGPNADARPLNMNASSEQGVRTLENSQELRCEPSTGVARSAATRVAGLRKLTSSLARPWRYIPT